MKKYWIYFAACVLTAGLLFSVYDARTPRYRVCRSFSYTGADCRETELYVIVSRPFDMRKTSEEIADQYKRMNGTPDRLTIWCYYNENQMDQGNEFYKAEYEYGEDLVTGPPSAW